MKYFLPIFAVLPLFFCQCSTHKASLDYRPNLAHGLRGDGKSNVTPGVFKDERDLPDTYLGQIREGIGPATKKIETLVPVAQIVSNTFGYGLQVRDMLARSGPGKFKLEGRIKEFSCDQMIRAGAAADIVVVLRDGAGQVVFRKSYTAENTRTSAEIGVLGDPMKLKELASRTLQEVVDKALDDPELREITDLKED